MKYGLECEFFVAKHLGWDRDNLVAEVGPYLVGGLDVSLTPDECGFLAEARGQPCESIREAVFSLMADIHRLEQAATKLDLVLIREPNLDVPFKVVMESRRRYSKGVLSFQNLYGHEAHKQKKKKTAGIHISMTYPKVHHFYERTQGADRLVGEFNYNGMWDWVQMFRYLDKEFKQEIADTKRNPGFYELKPDGRIEYRSLPNNVDFMKIIQVVETYVSTKSNGLCL